MFRSIHFPLLLFHFGLIVRAFTIAFTDDSQQCGNVKVTWARRADPAVQFQYPFYLYIVPLNRTAVIQQINNWNDSTPFGSALLDLPLAVSTSYILGVVDSQGRGVGHSSSLLVAQNSTNSACLSPQSLSSQSQLYQLRSQFQVLPTTQSSECPSLTLSFYPLDQPPRALIFSPGERPRNVVKTSTVSRSGFVRVQGFTSLSQAVVVYQANTSSPAFTSSLFTVGGTDSVQCGGVAFSPGTPSRPIALQAGSVIGYVFASVLLTALVTTSSVYLYNLRVKARQPPCLPPKERFILTYRLSTPRDRDLELARFIPLPASTTSLVSPTMVMTERPESATSVRVPGVPNSTPVTAYSSPSMPSLNHLEEINRPVVRPQSDELGSDPASLFPTYHHHNHNHYHHNTSPSANSVATKRSSHVPGKKRQSDVSTYLHSTRPSTFASGTRNSSAFGFTEAVPALPDSPTLPDVAAISPLHFNFDFIRSSRGSSKRSDKLVEKRSTYLKMEEVEESLEGGGTSSNRRRTRSLSRSQSPNNSQKSTKKARSVPR